MNLQQFNKNKRAWLLSRDEKRENDWRVQLCERQADQRWLATSEPWFNSTSPQAAKRLKDKWQQQRRPLLLLCVAGPSVTPRSTSAPCAEQSGTSKHWHRGLAQGRGAAPANQTTEVGPRHWPASAREIRDYDHLGACGLMPIAVTQLNDSPSTPEDLDNLAMAKSHRLQPLELVRDARLLKETGERSSPSDGSRHMLTTQNVLSIVLSLLLSAALGLGIGMPDTSSEASRSVACQLAASRLWTEKLHALCQAGPESESKP